MTISGDASSIFVGQRRGFPEPVYNGDENQRDSYRSERRRQSSVRPDVRNRYQEQRNVTVETTRREIPIREKRSERTVVREVFPRPQPQAQPHAPAQPRPAPPPPAPTPIPMPIPMPMPMPRQARSESGPNIIVEQEVSTSSVDSDAIVVVDEEPDSDIGHGPRYRVARPRAEAEGI
ncbi:hypothetical protein BP6252_02158 [Coleophoma cylindrospora]|uniref:Uncharacterized protein n=1 Tax=Coleophoma cylindrospora TaxID=1849047 RepID=A0A3D8SFN2_9HELO|nr:hypothetical protein BP6252_02158 [Coleophoma cylindrospora]